MKLGTIVFEGKIYNLDYMKKDEIKELLGKIGEDKKGKFSEIKDMLKTR